MLSDDDELNIYGDLDDFQNAEEKKSKELEAWETKYKGAQAEIEGLKAENKALGKKIKAMEVNLQNLMDTAKAEIKRKESMITQLRKEKDDICFRRKRGRADEDAKDVGQEHKRSKLSEPGSNKFKSAHGNDHENERPKQAEHKTLLPTESKHSEHQRPKLLAEPTTNRVKIESKELGKHKLEEAAVNKFRIEPKMSEKMHHQKSSTGGEANRDSKRTIRSRSPRDEPHKSSDRHGRSDSRLKERERRRSRSDKRSHRHEPHHRSRQSKDRGSKRRSVSRSPNRTAAAKPSARQPHDERSKGAQKAATVKTLFGEETNDKVPATPNVEMIKKMQENTSPATPQELYTPENKLQAIGGEKPAKNEEISRSTIDGYFQVKPQAKDCTLPASQAAKTEEQAATETLGKAAPTAGIFSWGSNTDKQQIPGLDMICQQQSPVKNNTQALIEQQQEDVETLGTANSDAIEDCIIYGTEEKITRPLEECRQTDSNEKVQQKQERLSLKPAPTPEAPVKVEASICAAPSKHEKNSMDIEEHSTKTKTKSKEKKGKLIPKVIEATAQVEDQETKPASSELKATAAAVTDKPPTMADLKTPTKCSDTHLDDDCPTPRRDRETTEIQAAEELARPTNCSARNTISERPSQMAAAIEIIEDIRLSVIVDIENIALTVDVPFDSSSEMITDGSAAAQDLDVVDGKKENEAEAELGKKASCVAVGTQIEEQETVADETKADGLADKAQGEEKEVPVVETPVAETPINETVPPAEASRTAAVETCPTATHVSENEAETETPEAETPAIELAATETKNETMEAAVNETPAVESPVADAAALETPVEETSETLVTEIPVKKTPAVAVPKAKKETCAMETPVTEEPAVEAPAAAASAANNETSATKTPPNAPLGETPATETVAIETPSMEEPPVAAVNASKNQCHDKETPAIPSTGIEIPILPPHGSIHDSLIVAATSKPSSILYAQPDSTKTDNSEDMVLEAAMNELTGEQEPVPSAANTSYPNLTLAEDTIEMALQQLHQTSPDETKVTSTSNKSQKTPQNDLVQTLTASPLQLSPGKSTSKGRKTTPMTTPEKLRVEKTPLKKRKIHMPEDEVLVPQTPPSPVQPATALRNEASPTLQHVTIDETLDGSINNSFGSDISVVTKRCSMGSTDYQFERINDEIVLRVSRRRRRPRPSQAPPLDDGEKSATT
ncbi:titin [Drosophila madeirensis]|uniref:Titin n=1 Tax=Drosophila madeirensis TaxID=30013 RepID=A0AAU9GFG6_DROMD